MTIELYSNNAETTLAAPISNVSTTLQMQSGAGALFPNPSAGEFFRISLTDAATQLNREIVYCTARSGDVCTIQRAQEGTTAQNWITGDIASNLPTAGAMENLVQQTQFQTASYNYGDDTGSANTYQVTYSPSVLTVSDSLILRFKAAHANTGASTFSPNGITAAPIYGGDYQALTGGEIVANSDVAVQWNSSLNGGSGAWVLTTSGGGYGKVVTPPTGDRSNRVATTDLFANEFAFLASANGYTKLPNGIIIQWGTFTGAGSGVTTIVTFPIAFPNNRFAVSAIGGGANNVTTSVWRDSASGALSLTQFPFATNVAGNGIFWIAVGN